MKRAARCSALNVSQSEVNGLSGQSMLQRMKSNSSAWTMSGCAGCCRRLTLTDCFFSSQKEKRPVSDGAARSWGVIGLRAESADFTQTCKTAVRRTRGEMCCRMIYYHVSVKSWRGRRWFEHFRWSEAGVQRVTLKRTCSVTNLALRVSSWQSQLWSCSSCSSLRTRPGL